MSVELCYHALSCYFLCNVLYDINVQALEELRSFMIVNGVAWKKRQKLMRNLRVCDCL